MVYNSLCKHLEFYNYPKNNTKKKNKKTTS